MFSSKRNRSLCVFASFPNIPQSSPLSWSFFSGSSHFFALQSTRAWTSASSFHVFSCFFHIITAPIPGEHPLNHQLYLWGLRQACHIRTQDASQAGGRMLDMTKYRVLDGTGTDRYSTIDPERHFESIWWCPLVNVYITMENHNV